MAGYIALINKGDDSDLGVSFPDFPGCIAAGATLDEARAMAQEALACHVEGLLEDGAAMPEPSNLSGMAGAKIGNGLAVYITFEAGSA